MPVYVDRRQAERRRISTAVVVERRRHDRRNGGERRSEPLEPEHDQLDVRRRRLRVQVLSARRAIGVSHDALKKKR